MIEIMNCFLKAEKPVNSRKIEATIWWFYFHLFAKHTI